MKYIKLFENFDNDILSDYNEIITSFNPISVKCRKDDESEYSVLIKDENSNFEAWVNVTIDNKDISCDWNKYIFNNDNSKDALQNKVQQNNDIFDDVTSEAINKLEKDNFIKQDENGDWYNI